VGCACSGREKRGRSGAAARSDQPLYDDEEEQQQELMRRGGGLLLPG